MTKQQLQTESKLTTKFFKDVRDTYEKSYCYKFHGGRFQKGFPDSLIIIEDEIFAFVEFKRKGNSLSSLQLQNIKKMVNVGALVLVITFHSNNTFECKAVTNGRYLGFKDFEFPKLTKFKQIFDSDIKK